MSLLKKCLLEWNNKYTGHITMSEIDDDTCLNFTLLDMQKFAKHYHQEQLRIGVVSQQRELLIADFIEKYNKGLVGNERIHEDCLGDYLKGNL